MIILGIDPGFADTGYGVIKVTGKEMNIIQFGSIKTKKTTRFATRLLELSRELEKIINQYRPDAVGLERLFFCNNVKTALAVGEARGVITLTVVKAGVPLHEYTPLQVKQALTGSGNADKIQVQKMLKLIFKMDAPPKSDDAADALAIAYCCAASTAISLRSSAFPAKGIFSVVSN